MTLCANKLHLLIGSISIWALFMNLEAWLTHKIYDDTLPKILKSLLKFAEFLSACEISKRLTPSLSKYSCFQKSAIWLIGRIFDPSQIKITNHLFNSEIWLIWKSWNPIGQDHFTKGQIKNLKTNIYVSWIYFSMPKIKLIHESLLEIF